MKKKDHYVVHVISNLISCRTIAVFLLHKYALRLQQNGVNIADDNFQLIILVRVLLHFDKKVTLGLRQKWLPSSMWLGAVGARIIDCLPSVVGDYSGAVDWSFLISTSCQWSHPALSNALRPKQNGSLFSSYMFKTQDLFTMNPNEHELPINLMNIMLCPVMLFRRHSISI